MMEACSAGQALHGVNHAAFCRQTEFADANSEAERSCKVCRRTILDGEKLEVWWSGTVCFAGEIQLDPSSNCREA
jgi:hypothetical protein